MLKWLLIIPLLGCLWLLITEETNNNKTKIKQIALSISLINFLFSIIIWILFDNSTTQFQFVSEFSNLKFCHFHIGLDGISLYFVLLTTFITPICILASWDDINKNIKYYYILFLLLETLQIGVFIVLDLLLFYIFFESVLIPLFIIIITWGASEAKTRAAYLLFLYTLFGSLFMLLAILIILNNYGSTDFLYISLTDINLQNQKILFLAFFLSFAIKTPLVPAHLWLFRAHAEAPLAGSVILAAIILKLASYGYLRILIPIFGDASNYFLPWIQSICIITLIYASLSTIRQSDLKQWIAYSSVAHMGVVVLGLMSNSIQSIEGAILLSIAHGYVSSGLFICLGGIIYNRYHTRNINYMRGFALTMPVFTLLFFILILANMGVPLSLNFLGEFLALTGIFEKNTLIGVLGATSIVLSAIYSIFNYNKISYGSFSKYLKPLKDIDRREFMLLLPLILITFCLGIIPNIILDSLHISVSNILYNII